MLAVEAMVHRLGGGQEGGHLMDTGPNPFALGSEDGEVLWFFGTLVTFKATAEQTGGSSADDIGALSSFATYLP
jgi:hypothetical protein